MSLLHLIRRAIAPALLILASLPAAAQQIDSTDIPAPNAVAPSNCPNIDIQWYGTGLMPANYFKSNGAGGYTAGYCYPIENCAAGTTWNSTTQACQANCGAGTSWNGSSCVSICTGGQVWNGSTCACPAGQTMVGGVCGSAPVITSFAMTSSVSVGSNYTLSWTASGATSTWIYCTGASPANTNVSPPASGSTSLYAGAAGGTNCQLGAGNAYGSVASAVRSGSASCPANTTWSSSLARCVPNTYEPLVGKTVYIVAGNFDYSSTGGINAQRDNTTIVSATSNGSSVSINYLGGNLCNLTAAGQTCAWNFTGGGAAAWNANYSCVRAALMTGPAGSVLNVPACAGVVNYAWGSSPDVQAATYCYYGANAWVTLQSDGGLSVVFSEVQSACADGGNVGAFTMSGDYIRGSTLRSMSNGQGVQLRNTPSSRVDGTGF